ncbi:murein L,D-transpeptidase catalytic domain family protein [Photobacterium leiognathi subsp. mandapamensis]|uniref:murein L,D-transpeptidase catalytic domain family protein n=1 Tax=Photobacterium leiognathi TaxID=553611 RepID=UPI003AF3CC99
MKKAIYLIILMMCYLPFQASAHVLNTERKNADIVVNYVYQKAHLRNQINYNVFKQAFIAYNKTKGKKKSLLTIIDYSKPSTQKRFYVIDLKQNKLLYKTYVSHGMNSGLLKASDFSNKVNSHKTSLGTFLTESTYNGGNGYSLKLNGLTRGKNDNALKRYIVIHGAKYVSESFIKRNGYLGRSWGCPALPEALAKKIIDTIKGGSVIFAYA